MGPLPYLLIGAIVSVALGAARAETIWSEDFTGQNGKGAWGPTPTCDTAGVTWTLDVSGCSLGEANDYAKVVFGAFEARDSNGEAIWRSPVVDISRHIAVGASVSLAETGTLGNDDYIRVYYQVNGGAETLFTDGNQTDDMTPDGGPVTATVSGLTGSTFRIVVRICNNADEKRHRFDSLAVTGTPRLSAPPWVAANPTNSFRFTARWLAVADAAGYRLDVASNAAFFASGTNMIQTSFEDTDGWASHEYGDWTETAHDGDWIGTSAYAGGSGERTGSRGIGFNDLNDALELPARDNPGTLTFWAKLSSDPSSANKLKVQRWNSAEWVDVTEFSIASTSFEPYSVTLARREAGVRLRLLCSDYDRTQYVDDLTLTEFTSHCVRGYDARRIAGVTTTNVAVTGLVSQTTYYCRVRATNDVQTSTNSVVFSVTTRPPPVITVGSLTGFDAVEVNTVSAEKTYTVSGANLQGDVTVSPPAGFEMATASGGPYTASGSSLTLVPVNGVLAETTLYVVFKPTSVAGYSGNISHASDRATIRQVAVSGSGAYSAESDFYSLGGEVANIAYHQFQATDIVRDGNSVDVAVFRLRDGGADESDADTADTVLTAVTFAVDNHAYLRRVALYDQSGNELGEVAAGATVSFGGLNVVAADGPAGAILILRVSFVTAVTDRERVRFTVTSVTAGAGGSGFAAADGGGAATADDKNRIQVTATKLVFTDAPTVTGVGTDFALALAARDANGNRDLDRASDVTLTRAVGTGTLYSATGLTRALVSGEADWSDLRVSRSGTFRIAAATTGLPAATTDVFRAYIHRETFETDGDGTRYTATGVHANPNAYFHRGRDGDFNSMAALTGEEGQWYFGGENTDANAGEETITLNALDVSHYTNLQIEAALAATATDEFESGSGENGDYVLTLTRLDGGPWRTNLAFRGAGSSAALSRDTDGDGVGDGAALGSTFQDFAAPATNGGNSFQWRVVFRTTAQGEEAAFDHLRVLGETLDRDSAILAPDEPLAATNVPAWADSAAEAITVLRFRVRDPGTVDPYPTQPRRLVIVPGPGNTADWTDTIQDVCLTVGGAAVPLTDVAVTDAALTLDLAAGAFAVTNGATRDLRLAVYLQATGLVDRARLQFTIPASGHGCLTESGAHSRFAASFPADVVSAVHTVRVAATRLVFAPGAPPAAVGVGRAFPVEVRALDANGNLDRSATVEVTLTRQSGTGTLASVSGLTANLTAGTNRWTDVTMDKPGLFTIRAAAAGLTPAVSAAVRAGEVWINEMDYDQDGTDTNEWIELAGAAGVCLNDFELALIGNGGTEYAVWDLATANWTFADETNGWGFFTIGKVTPGEGQADYTPSGWDLNEIQNGPDVSAQLRRKAPPRNAHLLDYYGQNTGTTEDQATTLFDRTDPKSSLYLTAGPGSSLGDFAWANTAGRATPGRINDGQTFVPPAAHAPRITPGAGAYRVDANAATLRGELLCGYPSPHVFICWGRNDAGSTFPGSWPNTVRLGPRSPGPFETELTGLARNTRYYYRCFATNALGVVPAVLATFQTLTTANTANYAVYVDDIGVAASPPQTVDVDGDGLPDAWETQRLGSIAASDGAPDKDSDSDGWTDRQEYLAGTDPASGASYLRVTTAGLSSATSPDVVLRFAGGNVGVSGPLAQAGDAPSRVYRILAADGDAANPKTLLATVTDNLTGTNTYTDTGARDRIGSRYYSIAVSYAGGSCTNVEEWAVHTQRRPPASRSLVCVPVDFGAGGNNLNGEAGRQLAIGLRAGDAGVSGTADRLEYRDAQRQWKEAYLVSGGPAGSYWWDPDTKLAANVPLTPGMPLWVVRTALLPARSNTVFAGRSFATAQTVNVTFTTNAGGWTLFGWPLGAKRHHRDLGAATPANQLGFEDRGVGGLHPELPAQKGDQIWVWESGGWRGRYWLMNTHGQPGGDQYNGRWWDSHRGRFADFALEAGKAYYYCHSTNWGGTNFVWRARAP